MSEKITRYRGDTAPDQFTFGQDVTGLTFRLTINSEETPTDQTNELLQMTGTIIAPASAGVVEFSPSLVEANALTPGNYFYDLQVFQSANTIVHTVCTGEYEILQDITKESS